MNKMPQPQPERKCPKCKGKIDWKVIHTELGAPQNNGLCKNCAIVFRDREAPEVTRGRRLEKSGKLKGLGAMDKRITSLPCDVQIGILRERQSHE